MLTTNIPRSSSSSSSSSSSFGTMMDTVLLMVAALTIVLLTGPSSYQFVHNVNAWSCSTSSISNSKRNTMSAPVMMMRKKKGSSGDETDDHDNNKDDYVVPVSSEGRLVITRRGAFSQVAAKAVVVSAGSISVPACTASTSTSTSSANAAAAAFTLMATTIHPLSARSAEEPSVDGITTKPDNNNNNNNLNKLPNLPIDELLSKITKDVTEKQFLVTGNISRELYDESATFIDNIDTYTMDQWIVGTSKLFRPNPQSRVVLTELPHIMDDGTHDIQFSFAEYLTFNIPLLSPVAYLTGKVILERKNVGSSNNKNGLITSYKEEWDQDVSAVYKSFRFFGDVSDLDKKLDMAAAETTADAAAADTSGK